MSTLNTAEDSLNSTRDPTLKLPNGATQVLQNVVVVERLNNWILNTPNSLRTLIKTPIAILESAGIPRFYLIALGLATGLLVLRTVLLGVIAWLDTLVWAVVFVVVVRVVVRYEWAMQRGMQALRADDGWEIVGGPLKVEGDLDDGVESG